jgi:putative transposase
MTLLSHKIELNPTQEQIEYFQKAFGVARFAYNWALDRWQETYKAGEKTSAFNLCRELNAIKQDKFPWMAEVAQVIPERAIIALGEAFNRFFKKQARYPKFKKKYSHNSFRAINSPHKKGAHAVPLCGKGIKLPKIGWVKMKQELRFEGQTKSAVVSEISGRYYVSILVDVKYLPHLRKAKNQVGVHFGIKHFATLSNGAQFETKEPYNALLNRIRRLSRNLSKKQKGSNNYAKAKLKLAKLHAKIANIRNAICHNFTTDLILNNTTIGIEQWDVQGMVVKKKAISKQLTRRILDKGFYELRRQIEYKAKLYGSNLIITDKHFPSSKTCNKCGAINDKLKLSDTIWKCECGAVHDREINAALNEYGRFYRSLSLWSSRLWHCRYYNVNPCCDEAGIQWEE